MSQRRPRPRVASCRHCVAVFVVTCGVLSASVSLLHLQIHIDIPRMSPEALTLQPRVTEVSVAPGRECLPGRLPSLGR